ncbi:uncharacterized protein Fot_53510 [Forsythia ovata]|uniref:Uncharacterized protein n=1 Tax=Forsythia ovata TaxID=205694 RepID=A0ABD1PLH1_9LAMI
MPTSENEQERMTSEEANVLSSCGANATRDFIIDFGGSSVVTWPATQRLSNFYRSNLTLGVAAFCGMWRFTRSVDSSIEHILSLEGSRVQRELANMTYYSEETDAPKNDPKKTNMGLGPRQVYANAAGDIKTNPFYLTFGVSCKRSRDSSARYIQHIV